MSTKRQRKRRGQLVYSTRNVKSKLGHAQAGVMHGNAKRIVESLDREEEFKTNDDAKTIC